MCYVPLNVLSVKKTNNRVLMLEPQDTLFMARLTERMKSMRLTQGNLASLAGLTHVAIHHYMKGSRSPKAAELSRLASALGVSMDWLWGTEHNEPNSDQYRAENIYLRKELSNLSSQLRAMTTTVERLRLMPPTNIEINSRNTNSILGDVNTNITINPPQDSPKS